jgi:hypothetical protein
MSGPRLDMSGLCRICLVKLDLMMQKNRSGAKTMNLDLDKLTACKLNTIELRELRRTIRSNLITRNHTYG